MRDRFNFKSYLINNPLLQEEAVDYSGMEKSMGKWVPKNAEAKEQLANAMETLKKSGTKSYMVKFISDYAIEDELKKHMPKGGSVAGFVDYLASKKASLQEGGPRDLQFSYNFEEKELVDLIQTLRRHNTGLLPLIKALEGVLGREVPAYGPDWKPFRQYPDLEEGSMALQGATRFIEKCARELGTGFHPDTPFSDYVDGSGRSVYSPSQAREMDAAMDRARQAFDENGVDIYDVAIQAVEGGSLQEAVSDENLVVTGPSVAQALDAVDALNGAQLSGAAFEYRDTVRLEPVDTAGNRVNGGYAVEVVPSGNVPTDEYLLAANAFLSADKPGCSVARA